MMVAVPSLDIALSAKKEIASCGSRQMRSLFAQLNIHALASLMVLSTHSECLLSTKRDKANQASRQILSLQEVQLVCVGGRPAALLYKN